MPDTFFASTKSRKRKRVQPRLNVVKKKQKGSKKLDEELSAHSGSDDNDGWGGIQDMDLRAEEPDPHASSGDENADETPAQKRLRLAQLYLDGVKESLADGEFDAAEVDKEIISSRLKQDILSHSGKVHLFIAESFSSSFATTQPPPTLRTRGHRFSVTAAVTSSSAKYLYTAGKEGTIIKWDLATGKKLASVHKSRSQPNNNSNNATYTTPTTSHPSTHHGKGKMTLQDSVQGGHTDEVLALALCSDGKYLASAGRDRRLIIWDAISLAPLKIFTQGNMNHKDAISSLAFRHSTYTLFTASFDRTIKIYDVTPSVLGYTETLFGHQDAIVSVSALSGENCVSVGGRDRTVRYWKVKEETQLVFRGGGRSKVREMLEGGLRADDDDDDETKKGEGYVEGSLESTAMIDESTFVTGGDSGSISLWSTSKKKPVFTYPLAHGLHSAPSSTSPSGFIDTPRWITALAALPYSDLFASGSWEGQIRLWKLDQKLKSFTLLGTVSVPGIINSLQLVSPPRSIFTSSPTANGTSIPSINSTTTATTTATPSLHPNSDSNSESTCTPSSWLLPSRFHSLPPSSSLSVRRTNGLPSSVVFLVAGTGQEHKFGRWLSVKEGGARNGACVVALVADEGERTF